MRTVRATSLFATLASAVLYGLAFPPVAWRVLAWVALVPFFIAVRAVRLRAALGLAVAWTFAMAYAVGDCFPRAVATYYNRPFIVGIGFFVAVSTLLMAVYYAPFAAFYRAVARDPGPWSPLLVGAAWVTAELARVRSLVGHPWALIGYSQTGIQPLIQIADVTGVYGVSFLVVATNAALADLCWTLRVAGRSSAKAGRGLVPVVLLTLVVLSYGSVRRMTLPPLSGGAVETAVVQANLDLGSQWRDEMYGQNLDAYLRLTQQALHAGSVQLVIWPESSMTFLLDQEPMYRRAIAVVIGQRNAELVAGGPRFERSRYYNSAFLVSPAGTVLARYDKQLLLPFAEYFPFARFATLQRRFARVREFTPGDNAVSLPTVAGRGGVVVCNEAMFPDMVAQRVRAGATYLINLANDTWLGDSKYSLKMFEIATWRAVEQRRMLVRASTSGPSAFVDVTGAVLRRTAPFTAATITGTIQPSTIITTYCRVGDAFAFGCAAIVALTLLRWALTRIRDSG